MEFLLLSFLLGSDSFKMREAAHIALESKTSVELCFVVPLNVEAERRLRQLKENALSKDIDFYIKRKNGNWPPIEYNSYTSQYLNHPANNAEKDIPAENFWPRYAKATEIYVRDRLSNGESFQEIEIYLKKLEKEHENWTQRWKPQHE